MNDNCFVATALSLCDATMTLPDLVAALAVAEPNLSQNNLECVARQSLAVFPALVQQREAEAAARERAEAAARAEAANELDGRRGDGEEDPDVDLLLAVAAPHTQHTTK